MRVRLSGRNTANLIVLFLWFKSYDLEGNRPGHTTRFTSGNSEEIIPRTNVFANCSAGPVGPRVGNSCEDASVDEVNRSPYPVALALPAEDSGTADAIAWLLHTSAGVGGTPLVLLADRQRLRGDRWLRAFVDDAHLPLATSVLPEPGWSGGVVLAAWPTAERLATVAADPRVRGLCVVAGDPGAVDVWVRTTRPHLLGAGAVPGRPPGLDPVVAEALTTLTGLVDPSGTLSGVQARRDVVGLLVIAHEGGHRFSRESVYAWTMAHGWSPRAARRVAALAAHVAAGRRPAAPPFRPDILAVWRERALAQPAGDRLGLSGVR